jgi:hypothetical protein
MAEVKNELSKLLGQRGLDPLQQTIYEQGPKNSFVAPEVQNVYQEGKVYFPSPQVQVENSDVAWYKLGEFAFDAALKTFTNVQDYLIDTKRNGIVDAKDQAQTALFDLESKLSVESYNAGAQKREKQAALIEDMQAEAKLIRKTYADKVKNVLGEDHDLLLNPNLDMGTLGLKYQNLALTSRGSDRDISRTANRMLYQLERVNKNTEQVNDMSKAWMAGAGITKDNISAFQTGLAPIPTNGGAPVIGADVQPDGSFKVKTTVIDNREVPLLIQHEGQEGYFLNLQAIDAASWDDLQGLVVLDQKSSYLASPAAKQFTKTTEDIITNVANTEGSSMSTGMSAYAGQVLAQFSDSVAERMINGLSGLGTDVITKEGARMKLMMLRDAAIQRMPIEQINTLTAMSNQSLGQSIDGLRKLQASSGGLIYGNIRETGRMDELNLEADAILKVIAGINPEEPLLKQDFKFKPDSTGSGFTTANPNNAIILSHFLQKNPGLMPVVARVMATAKDNSALYTNADGTIDPAKRSALLGKLLHEQVNSSNYVNLGAQADGTPTYIYNPGLMHVQQSMSELARDTQKIAGWPTALKDSSKHQQVMAQTAWFSTDIGSTSSKANIMEMSADQAYEAARSFIPTADKDLFVKGWEAMQAVQDDPEYGYRSASLPPMAMLYRLALAATPAVQEKSGAFAMFSVASPEQREQAMKRIMDDFPLEVDPTTGFMPGISIDIDTGASSLDFIGAANGGIPIAITGIKGKSGIDYMDAAYSISSRVNGRVIPKGSDGMPSLMIHASSVNDKNPEFSSNLKRLGSAYRGNLDMSIATNEDMPNGNSLNIRSEEIQNVISATTTPYLPKKAQAIFGNILIDQPLVNAETAIASLSRNGVALREVVDSDPQLSKVKKLMYEVADINGRGPATVDNRVLFSPENLQRLYTQAVARGAKTQGDFVGFVLGTMKTFQENRASLKERDFVAQNQTNSDTTQDIVMQGEEQGRILWKPSSPRFFDFVTDQARQSKTVYSGPAPEDPENKTAYYVMDAEQATQRGLTVAIDATMLPDLDASPRGKSQAKRRQINATRDILFPSKPQADTISLTEIGRQSTLPSNMQKQFQEDFNAFVAKNDISDFVDLPFIDLSGYYTDNGKMPDDIAKVPQKYILPGHSSTRPWVDRRERKDSFGRKNELVQNIKDTTKTIQTSGFSDEQLRQAEEQLGFPVYVPGKIANVVIEGTSSILGGLFGFAKTVDDALSKGMTQAGDNLNADIEKNAIEVHRQQTMEQYNKDPYAWYNKVFGGDALTALRRNPPNKNEVKVPEKFFNFINAVVDFGEPMGPSPFHYLGITTDRQKKLISTGWSTLETEYQIRLGLSNKSDILADIHETIDNLEPNTFNLSSSDSVAFASSIYEAAKDTDNPLTREEAKVLAVTPAWRPDLKKAYFNLSLYPDGYAGHTYKTTRESIVDALRKLLK